MTYEQIIGKMNKDLKIRKFSHWPEKSYLIKTKDVMQYFKRQSKKQEIFYSST